MTRFRIQTPQLKVWIPHRTKRTLVINVATTSIAKTANAYARMASQIATKTRVMGVKLRAIASVNTVKLDHAMKVLMAPKESACVKEGYKPA